MGGATAPLWVTIMLAALTVIGTVAGAWGGQLIATRRDDKRWEREAVREDLRWRRDQQQQADDRAHADRVHWRAERLEAYTKIVAALVQWREAITKASRSVEAEEPITSEQLAELRTAEAIADERFEVMHVVGPLAVQRAMVDCMNRLRVAQLRIFQDQWILGTEIGRAYLAMMRAIRTALGIDDYDPATPSPPSETTS